MRQNASKGDQTVGRVIWRNFLRALCGWDLGKWSSAYILLILAVNSWSGLGDRCDLLLLFFCNDVDLTRDHSHILQGFANRPERRGATLGSAT